MLLKYASLLRTLSTNHTEVKSFYASMTNRRDNKFGAFTVPKKHRAAIFPLSMPNIYRNGISSQLLEGYSDNVKNALSLTHGNREEIKKAHIKQFIAQFGNHPNDHGSAAIQACVACEDAIALINHIRLNKKDVTAKLGLGVKLKKRKVALRYLMNKSYATYTEVIRLFNIPIGVGVPNKEMFKKERMFIGCEKFVKEMRTRQPKKREKPKLNDI